jgi:hypothetical protein
MSIGADMIPFLSREEINETTGKAALYAGAKGLSAGPKAPELQSK